MEDLIYITGDSFCAHRDSWPKMLADKLGLDLVGQGYSGYGWWPSCQDFVSKFDLQNSMQADGWSNRTKVFIFCHTDIHRPLTSNRAWVGGGGGPGYPSLMDYHLKYISDPAADTWCAERWYKQIGEVIERSGPDNKTVIHLNCFNSNQHLRKFLKGKVFETPLIDVAMRGAGGDPSVKITKDVQEKINDAPNHLCGDYNEKFAQFLYDNLDNNVTEIKL